MVNKNVKTWIWMQNNRLLKAVLNQNTGTLTIYDEYDNILLRRMGLTKQQTKNIEIIFSNHCIKRVDGHREPFTYL
ncbi:MAG: hypothetical protein KAV40_03810 [Thermoplasmatales archaeon]|nr:hypothetical protein [Thermoplasmatales archaeon]